VIDSADFERFYRDTLPRLEKFVARLAGSRAAAEELVQEAYYRFLRAGFEGGSDEERRRYLYRIAVNLAKNRWAKSGGPEARTTPGTTRIDDRRERRARAHGAARPRVVVARVCGGVFASRDR
jgi:DNA-directed RNA polymerase specialized sigma24 family protein